MTQGLLDRAHAPHGGEHAPSPFEFTLDGHAHAKLHVLTLHAVEEMNELYRARVLLACPADSNLLESPPTAILGRSAVVVVHAGEARRRIQGIVTSVKVAGFDQHQAR